MSEVRLGRPFQDAVVFALELHADQKRKGTDIPYVSHLLAVAALVLEDGGNEEEAIAAVLHDAIEDQGGAPTRESIRRMFGAKVAKIVDECTDTDQTPKPPWRTRKENYLRHLPHASSSALRISLADKLHNARAILRDLRKHGNCVWQRFSASKSDIIWYYTSLTLIYGELITSPLVGELEETLAAIVALDKE